MNHPDWEVFHNCVVYTIDQMGCAAYFTAPVRLNPHGGRFYPVVEGKRYDVGLTPRGPDHTAKIVIRPGKEEEYRAILEQNPAPTQVGQHRFGFLDEINGRTHSAG